MLFYSLRVELVKYFNGCLVTRSKVMVIKTNSEHHKNDKSMNMNGGGDLPLGHLACLIIQLSTVFGTAWAQQLDKQKCAKSLS